MISLELAFFWTMFWWTRTMEDVGASPATGWWLVSHPAGRLMFSHFIHGQWIQIDPNSVRGFEVRRRCDFASNSILAVVIPIFDSFGRQIDMFFTPDSRGLLPGEAMKPEWEICRTASGEWDVSTGDRLRISMDFHDAVDGKSWKHGEQSNGFGFCMFPLVHLLTSVCSGSLWHWHLIVARAVRLEFAQRVERSVFGTKRARASGESDCQRTEVTRMPSHFSYLLTQHWLNQEKQTVKYSKNM